MLLQFTDEKDAQIQQLLDRGKERGFLLYDDFNVVLSLEAHAPEEIHALCLLPLHNRASNFTKMKPMRALRLIRRIYQQEQAAGTFPSAQDYLASAEDELDLSAGETEKVEDPANCIAASRLVRSIDFNMEMTSAS